MTERKYLDVEDLDMCQKLCRLNIEVSATYNSFRTRYKECIRMLNGMERTLEQKLPAADRRWKIAENTGEYGASEEHCPTGWPSPLTPQPLTPVRSRATNLNR